MDYGVCKECKKFYQKERPTQQICSYCMKTMLFKKTEKPGMKDIQDIANLARKYGMSYGEFVAKYDRR